MKGKEVDSWQLLVHIGIDKQKQGEILFVFHVGKKNFFKSTSYVLIQCSSIALVAQLTVISLQ